MQLDSVSPLWDEGISSFLRGEYDKKQVPLTTSDLQSFAVERAFRVGDMLETLFLMAISGVWSYTDAEGVAQLLDEQALDELYAKGRLKPEDLQAFSGVWAPI